MTSKTCKSCKKTFVLTDEEIKFLDKISPQFNGKKYPIPAPEACPDCRLKNRTIYRNEQYLYQNKSAISGQPLISLYSPDTPWGQKIKVLSYEEYFSDKWDAQDFGMDFDFSRPFFEQFNDLDIQIPKQNLMQTNNENSPYTTGTGYCKNCHLINCSENDEDCYYGKLIQSSRDIMDSAYIYNSELLYECFNSTKCYDCKYVSYSQNCSDCWFSENLIGCKNCFLCTNLSNKEYHLLNQPLKKEEYNTKIKEYISSAQGIEKAREILKDLAQKRIYKYANIINCENSTGDLLTNCKNCTDSFDVNDSEDCKYLTVGVNAKDLFDCSNMYLKPELNYQVLGTIGTYNVIFSLYLFTSSNIIYSQNCWNNCSNLFGCSGLRGRKFCILNKQYSEEQYNELVPKIIEHMRSTGEWGEFFPVRFSPFGYNETVAQEYLPLTRDEALANGFKWKEQDKKDFKPQTYKVPLEIKDVKDDILNAVLACEDCGKNYKIIPQELKRLRNINFPIPKKCPDCRLKKRMLLRNPRKLWARTCAKCNTPIQTTYSPQRPEIVYCERCYLNEL
jgi:hypothetical protein